MFETKVVEKIKMFQAEVVEKIKMFQTEVVEKIKMFQTEVVEKIKTHFMLNYFFLENRAVYEIMWKNTVQPDRQR
jgi:adenine-specific DNA methylase